MMGELIQKLSWFDYAFVLSVSSLLTYVFYFFMNIRVAKYEEVLSEKERKKLVYIIVISTFLLFLLIGIVSLTSQDDIDYLSTVIPFLMSILVSLIVYNLTELGSKRQLGKIESLIQNNVKIEKADKHSKSTEQAYFKLNNELYLENIHSDYVSFTHYQKYAKLFEGKKNINNALDDLVKYIKKNNEIKLFKIELVYLDQE